MGEAKIKFILKEKEQKERDFILEIQSKPVTYQRYMYFNRGSMGYHGLMVIEKDDRISVVVKEWYTMFVKGGMIIKSKPSKFGVTYYKTGRSSQRVSLWGGNQIEHSEWGTKTNDLAVLIAEEIDNKTAISLIKDPILSMIGTKGMLGYIMSGAITTIAEAMEYYIRYSLRGLGIRKDLANELYQFCVVTNMRKHDINSFFITAKSPNSILEKYDMLGDDVNITNNIQHHRYNGLIHMAKKTGEKIDWSDPQFDGTAEAERLSRKDRWIKEMLQLWDGGPVLKASGSVKTATTDIW